MPNKYGIPTNAEIDAMAEAWDKAPSKADFPPEETARIKADPTTLGWLEHPHGEVYFNNDYKFFSPCHPAHADALNMLFCSGPLMDCAADGDPVRYYLNTAANWAKCPYFMKPRSQVAGETEVDDQRLY